MIYLAAPYTKVKDKEKVFQVCNRIAALLFSQGKQVFSPISHSHLIDIKTTKKVNWVAFDAQILAICSDIYVVCMDGYKESEGLRTELKQGIKQGKRIFYIDEKGYLL